MRKVSFLLVGTFIFTAAAVAQNEFQFKEAGSQTVFMQRLGGPESEAGFVFMDMAEGNQVVKGAPYTATAITETTQVLADGNRISHKNTASLARDGQGRTRREETIGKMGPCLSMGPRW